MLASGRIPSIILWGPPGTGKTTLARIIAETTGVSLAQSDEVRRAMGSPTGIEQIEAWWRPAAAAPGPTPSPTDPPDRAPIPTRGWTG